MSSWRPSGHLPLHHLPLPDRLVRWLADARADARAAAMAAAMADAMADHPPLPAPLADVLLPPLAAPPYLPPTGVADQAVGATALAQRAGGNVTVFP